MITEIHLRHFKCFALLRLPLSPLTILSGANSSGKSSVLQALVLLHQTMREQEWSTRLMLNGDVIRLGTVADVVDEIHGRGSIEIGIEHDDCRFHWVFDGNRTDMSMSVGRVETPTCGEQENPESLKYLLPTHFNAEEDNFAERIKCLTYITAERIGPREVYPLHDRQSTPVVGPKGEHATSVLYSGLDEPTFGELCLDTETRPQKRHQVTARMRGFFPGFEMNIATVPNVNVVTLGLKTSAAAKFHRPTNVGFGVTQVFPIVVAAISAGAGDILLIENPEVHLHPAGQAVMGQFLADVAQAGVQVIVETHSDHILSGVRRAVKEGNLDAENVAIHFFQPRDEGESSQVISPTMGKTGNIDDWPDGFFDQLDKDANYFAGWGE
ncbi:MAG: DUF3696 domain-containing protein [Gammaproteobacteria bacterium]